MCLNALKSRIIMNKIDTKSKYQYKKSEGHFERLTITKSAVEVNRVEGTDYCIVIMSSNNKVDRFYFVHHKGPLNKAKISDFQGNKVKQFDLCTDKLLDLIDTKVVGLILDEIHKNKVSDYIIEDPKIALEKFDVEKLRYFKMYDHTVWEPLRDTPISTFKRVTLFKDYYKIKKLFNHLETKNDKFECNIVKPVGEYYGQTYFECDIKINQKDFDRLYKVHKSSFIDAIVYSKSSETDILNIKQFKKS